MEGDIGSTISETERSASPLADQKLGTGKVKKSTYVILMPDHGWCLQGAPLEPAIDSQKTDNSDGFRKVGATSLL